MTVRKERWLKPWGTFLGAWRTKIFLSEPPLFRMTFLGKPRGWGFWWEIVLFSDNKGEWWFSGGLGLSMAPRMFHLGLTTSFYVFGKWLKAGGKRSSVYIYHNT